MVVAKSVLSFLSLALPRISLFSAVDFKLRDSPFMRTLLLAVSMLVAGPAFADDWTGKTVITKRNGIRIGHSEGDGRQVFTAELKLFDFQVRKDRDGYLLIAFAGQEDWAPKSEFVLLDDAPAFFTEQIQANPADPVNWHRRGVAWRLKNNVDAAIRDFDESLRLSPDPAVFLSRGNALFAKGEIDRAIRDFNETIRLDPKAVDAFNNRGLAWAGKRDFDAAIRDYSEAIRLDPKSALAFNNRGIAWASKQDFDRAIRDYDEAIRLDPSSSAVYANRGYARSAKADYDRALLDYDEAIRLDPKSAYALSNRGIAWARTKEFDRALRDLDQAIQLNPNDSAAWYFRAIALNRQNKSALALESLEKALALGWRHFEYMEKDPDLDSLRADPAYKALVAKYQK